MKKSIWWLFLILALCAIFYFVVYPNLSASNTEAKVNNASLQPVENDTGENPSLMKIGWEKPVVHTFERRDIPSLEKEFYALGYPPFLYLPGEDGAVSKDSNSGEKSFHEKGMEVYLYMDSTYYMTHAKIEYGVGANKFNSVSMSENILPFVDFTQIITGVELSNEDVNNLLRSFTALFNDSEAKPRGITLNGLSFRLYLDKFYNLIIMEC